MVVWDVYSLSRITDRRGILVDHWTHHCVPAETPEQLVEALRGLKIKGTFRAYPQEGALYAKAHVVETFVVERLR